ncbi:hypothetical protein N7510_009603 [Penicillium lagena]|uniref:uncharacterized protein n=1 Tax=Penicillium lagena TaxID=94218 RepID=UPI002541003E|nr:uncharacterized protein N7510_009603 [Penicillium lagena]KAJ5604449.1 hypothetical protein N7510_009603 [Penicillium lagena]
MPPLSAYTPFESLLFFQSLATSDDRPASFGSISALLRSNPFVRQHVAFNADRLSSEALEDLYATLLRDGYDRDNSGASNPKKRKISSPKPDGFADGVTHAKLIPELVSHLYARYRELVTKEIRDDEKRYIEIKNELDRLQKEAHKAESAKPEDVPESMDIDVKEETPHPEETGKALAGPVPEKAATVQEAQPSVNDITKVTTLPEKAGQPQPPSTNGQPSLPGTQPAIAPRAQPVDAATPGAAAQAVRATAAHPSQLPPRANVPVASTPAEKPGPAVSTESTATPRVSAQPTFQQWQLEPSPQSPYPAITPGTAAPQVGQTTGKQPLPPISTAQPPLIPSTPGASAAHTPVPIGHARMSQTPSATALSFSESRRGSRPRLSIDTPGSSTPWRRTPHLSVPGSPVSPVRPGPDDVSPISERAPSPGDEVETSMRGGRAAKKTRRAAAAEDKAGPKIKTEKEPGRRKRAVSAASSRSRRQSVVSRDEESPEPPEDGDRDLRSRKDEPLAKSRSKRKRGPSEALEQEPLPPETPKIDTTRYVLCARGFHRTAQTILNDVTMHKLASIFAKPLTERDAPGYHDLIYRPQDLKSIKSAVHQASKAVSAAAEAPVTASLPAPAAGTPTRSGMLQLPKTEDLIPPKGIVNSAQLEKELTRMFANAIMFNPIPERGFGPAFPMISDRNTRESTETSGGDGDEGGIIQDSLEMFDDVEQAVNRWRAAERTADELANNKNILSLRRGSASDFNTDSADDAKG